MCKVYLYSRVSTSAQTLEQQERTVYEWLNAHNMKVDEVVSDEGVSGGVSYSDRNLGKVLLPKMQAGDMLIVSEISRLGRSMFNLSELIHKELKPRKIRLVCVNMSIDLNCAKMTAIDELIISNFSFAAQLEKQLISERTLSALEVKRKQGVKLGSANEKYRASYDRKTEDEKRALAKKRGDAIRKSYMESRDVQAFLKVLTKVFPDDCKVSLSTCDWRWRMVNTKGDNKTKMLQLMRDYRDLDRSLFKNWNFEDKPVKLQMKLASLINTLKREFI